MTVGTELSKRLNSVESSMKRLLIPIVAIFFAACNTASDGNSNVKASSGSYSEAQDQEALQEYLRERSGYNALFKSVVSDIYDAWDSMLDIFGDYVVKDPYASDFSSDFKGIRGFGGYNDDDNELY